MQGLQVCVKVVDAGGVVDVSVRGDDVDGGAAVLGDVDRRQCGTVAIAQPDQQVPQAVGDDRPAECGGGYALDRQHVERQRGIGRGGPDPGRVVVVDAQGVHRRADDLQV